MNLKKVNQVLTEHQLRKTAVRKKVLSAFLTQDTALTNQDIETFIEGEIDRITLYRTLNKFVDHGILHRIEQSNNTHYALCNGCEVDEHNDNHIHFQCSNCEKVECFDQPDKISITVPERYQINKLNLLVEGICSDCAEH